MEHYEGDDSNHSVNGWIKKEIIEDEDFEEYIKQEHEDEPADRYEELMNLSKEDLVGRILQQEEDIRYLQDLRQGLEKSVQDLASSCTRFRNLLSDMNTAVSTLKSCQSTSVSSAPARSAATASATPSVPRSFANTSTAQASPRSTPTVFPSSTAPSPRPTPTATTTSRTVTNPPQNQMTASNVVTSDRLNSGNLSSHKTVTITRSTDVTVIKTEIPSPPPPGYSNAAMPSGNTAGPGVVTSRSIAEPLYPTTRQQQQMNHPVQSNFSPAQPRLRQTNQINFASQQQQQQRTRQNPSAQFMNVQAGPRPNQMTRTNMPMSFRGHRQMTPTGAYPVARGGRGRGQICRQEVPFSSPIKTPVITPINVPPVGRPRMPTQTQTTSIPPSVPRTPVQTTEASEKVKMPSGITLPSGLTLSIVSPKAGGEQKAQQQQALEKSAATIIPTSESSGVTISEENSGSSKNINDKNASSGDGTSNAAQSSSYIEEEDEEEDGYFDEIAVLIPDRKSSPTMDSAGTPTGSDGGQVSQSSVGSKDSYSQSVVLASSSGSETYWSASNSAGGKPGKPNQGFYQNNDEYMFEEPEEIESDDEHHARIYLAEDVSLPKDLVDSCIKQGPNPTKLTRNLMKALFPDIRELASGCTSDDTTKPSQPSLPVNKVKAIIAQVQKIFPQCKRSAIIMAMNVKCREARVMLNKNSQQQQQAGQPQRNTRSHVQYQPY